MQSCDQQGVTLFPIAEFESPLLLCAICTGSHGTDSLCLCLLGYTNLINIQVSKPAGPSRNDLLMSFAVIRWDGSQSYEAAFEEICQSDRIKVD